MHRRESRRASNTARLALACLPNSELVVRDEQSAAPGALLAPPGTVPLVLFPAANAVPLTQWSASARQPMSVVVLDGTWNQASRMARRTVELRGLPFVSLPEGPPSRYRLRAADRPSRVSTLEAVARALSVLESPAVGEALDRVLTMMVDRTLWMRGRLDRSEVTGGIPAGLPRHFERWSTR